MANSNSISAREIKMLLTIDSDFKFDNVEKGKKLYAHLLSNGKIRSSMGAKYLQKLNTYCETGIVPAICPSCKKFAEGKGRVFCMDCAEKFQNMVKAYDEKKQQTRRAIEPVEELTIVDDAIRRAKAPVQEITRIKTVDEVYDRDKYFIFIKKRFYCAIAAAVALLIAVNVLVSMRVISRTTETERNLVKIENEMVPTGIDK